MIAGCELSSGASKTPPKERMDPATSEPADKGIKAPPEDTTPATAGRSAEPPASEMTPPAPPMAPPPTKEKPPKEKPPELPDLRLEVLDPEHSVKFRQQLMIDQSCEMVDGCATQTGVRALMSLEFTLRNDGKAPLVIGSPWEADIYQSSSCDQAYIPDLFSAELRNGAGTVVSRGKLATKCIETESGSYTCGAQGLGAREVSTQPQGSCDFLDVTELPAGDYMVRATVNPERLIKESNFDNNTVEWSVHINPVVAETCGHIQCGATCCPVGASCDNGVCNLPDLRVNYEAAADPGKLQIVNRTFGVDSCEADEMCVGGTGDRRLLLFEGRLENWGPGDLDLGPQEGNPLFTYSECHGHYHTQNFAQYSLLNADGSVAAEGHKQGYCLSDMSRIDDPAAPSAERPPPGRTTPCNRLTAGYADVYDTETPCQWIDITGVPAGQYMLEVTINPDGHIAEVTTDNNTIDVPVTIPGGG